MRLPRLHPAATAALVALLAAGCVAVVAVAFALGRTHVAARSADAAGSGCAKRLLADWSDGRIDVAYPIRCYRNALETLPADLEVYSSAAEDIAQALSRRIAQSHTESTSTERRRNGPVRRLASTRVKPQK